MIFTSFEFLVFFVVLAAAYFLSPARLGWLVLLVGSFLFYGWHNPSLLPFLLLPALATYFMALQITRGGPAPHRRRFLILGLGFASLGLVIFKYADFIGFSLVRLVSFFIKSLHYEPLNLLLPIGISFYTFRMISYLIDVYRENCRPRSMPGISSCTSRISRSCSPGRLSGPRSCCLN